MATLQFRIEIRVRGPVLTKSSAPGTYGVDAPFARNAEGKAYLPGTLIKGRIREALEEFHGIAPGLAPNPAEWLGPPPDAGGNRRNKGGNFERHNTRVFFSDFVLEEDNEEHRRVRIQLDSDRKSADEQMLQILESPVAPGKSEEFTGTVRFEAGAGETATSVRKWLIKALRWSGCVGSTTTSGFGHITNVKVDLDAAEAEMVAKEGEDGSQIHLQLTTEDLVCVTQWRNGENLFESGEIIPGAVLKGALAAQWLREIGAPERGISEGIDPARAELAAAYERLRFRHARPRPAKAAAGPMVIPLSMGWTAGKFRDFCWDKTLPATNGVISFQPDWKGEQWEAASKEFRQTEISKELRVRTAIDSEKRRAKDEALFAMEMVRGTGLEWRTTIDLGDESPKVREQLLGLLGRGLRGVGKTKAHFRVGLVTEREKEVPAPRDGMYAVTLETPAILANPAQLHGRDAGALEAAYAAAWRDLSCHTMELDHFFARQRLAGGLYLYKRFQVGRRGGYAPYLLTEAGSVFVLRVIDADKAKEVAANWLRRGIGTPTWARLSYSRGGRDGADWRNNPYVAENGYGEVSVRG